MAETVIEQLEFADVDRLSAPFEIDLVELFKLFQSEILDLIDRAKKEGMSEEDFLEELDLLFEE